MSEPGSRDSSSTFIAPIVWVAITVVILCLGALMILYGVDPGTRSVDGEPIVEVEPVPGLEQDAPARQVRPTTDLDGVLQVASGDVIFVEAGQVEAAGTIRLELLLPIASIDDSARPVRVYAEHQAPIHLETSPFGSDRTRARIDLAPGTLNQPGRYIIEIETTEKSHIPLRRFAIEVR